jgi:hypothetical protein
MLQQRSPMREKGLQAAARLEAALDKAMAKLPMEASLPVLLEED